MADITITVTEIVDGVSVVSSPTSLTVFDGVFVDTGAGGGGGAVTSVNGETGTVVLSAADVGAATTAQGAKADTAVQPGSIGTAAALNVPTTGDATSTQVVKGTDTRLADARIPTTHTHTAAQISDSTTTGRAVVAATDAAAARTAIGAGTSSLAIGTTSTTAAAGNDSRLSDARTPTAHAASHAAAGSDPLTLAESQVTGLVTDLAAKAPLASPTLTGTVTIPTVAGTTDSTTKAASTAFVQGVAALKADLASPALTGNPTAPTQTASNNSARLATTAYTDNAVAKQAEVFMVAVSDETTAITTGTAKVTFRMPFAMTLTSVRASLTTASSSGLPTVNIKETGTTIFSTNLSIDASEKTSTTAATPAVLSDTSLADDAEMTIDVTVAGTGATGLKVYFIGTRT